MSEWSGTGWTIYQGHVLDTLRRLPAKSVHCCVTSPPYWGLRDYGTEPVTWGDGWCGSLGHEETPAQFVGHAVEVFAEVARVLRDDGTLWVNMGDSYSIGSRGRDDGQLASDGYVRERRNGKREHRRQAGELRPKNLIGQPWLVAFALRDQLGLDLRADVVWHKPNPMPESIRDRPMRCHEQLFLFAKGRRYFWDPVSSAEVASGKPAGNVGPNKYARRYEQGDKQHRRAASLHHYEATATRLMRSVWSIPSHGYRGAHFATFPPELVRRCLVASTSAAGCCPVCATPWRPRIERLRVATRPGTRSKVHRTGGENGANDSAIVGNRDTKRHVTDKRIVAWEPGCQCGLERDGNVPPLVLDPFCGAGTTAVVARRLGLSFVGCELSTEYCQLAAERVVADRPIFNGPLVGSAVGAG